MDDLPDLVVGDEDALEAHGPRQVRWLVEHVASPDEVFGARRIEDGARVDL
jgi:hypothetical protein